MGGAASFPGNSPTDREGERDDVFTELCEARIAPLPGARIVFHGNPCGGSFEQAFRDVYARMAEAIGVSPADLAAQWPPALVLDAVGDADDLDDQRVHAGNHVGGVGQGLSRHGGGSPLIDPRILLGEARESVPGDCAAVGEGSAR